MDRDTPEKLLLLNCSECSQRITVQPNNQLLKVGDLNCPNPECSHIYHPLDDVEEVFYNKNKITVLAHRLWSYWSMDIAEEEDIKEDRVSRWKKLWIPFSDLTKEMKDKDRELVNRFLQEEPEY